MCAGCQGGCRGFNRWRCPPYNRGAAFSCPSIRVPWQLSGGEKVRTAVARALINRPKLILADEPTGSLDPASTDTVADLLLALNRDHGVTLILVTHNPAIAQRMGITFEMRNSKLH
jgi:lipoprotein-releasing system ATP-binding protein